MSEVDRLSTSGTYPALPMAAKRRAKEDSPQADQREKRGDPDARDGNQEPALPPRSPASLIDEYA